MTRRVSSWKVKILTTNADGWLVLPFIKFALYMLGIFGDVRRLPAPVMAALFEAEIRYETELELVATLLITKINWRAISAF